MTSSPRITLLRVLTVMLVLVNFGWGYTLEGQWQLRR
jgi:hypothetical protein